MGGLTCGVGSGEGEEEREVTVHEFPLTKDS